jgi:hypothetical protein
VEPEREQPADLLTARSLNATYDPQMSTRPKRWSGDYIVVWSDNSWEFFRCCRCGGPLEDTASRKRGLGPGCKERAALDEVSGIKNQEREKMRDWLDKQSRKRRWSRPG